MMIYETARIAVLATIAGLAAAVTVPAQQKPNAETPVDTFWNDIRKLCGKAFAGTVAAAPADDTTFRGKTLVMHVRSCQKYAIRIPFIVGDDRSRTWILTKKDARLELRHDHRHEDGKPDAVTMYGGRTTNAGLAGRQVFPADDQTFRVVPAAAPNVWWIDISAEAFTYNLRRMGSERFFSIKFDLTREMSTPPPPWGWSEKGKK